MPGPDAAAQIQTGKMLSASAIKVLHRSRILNRPFRNLQPVALTIGACLCFGCVYQVYRQDEARAISAFALPIDIAPHNPIGLATGVSPAAAESSNRLRAAGQGHPDNSFFIEEAYNQEPSVVQHIEFARIPTVPFRLAEGIVAQLKE